MNQLQLQMLTDALSGELRTDAVDMRTLYALQRRGLVTRSYPNVIQVTPNGEYVLRKYTRELPVAIPVNGMLADFISEPTKAAS
jgi:hypothetical protein